MRVGTIESWPLGGAQKHILVKGRMFKTLNRCLNCHTIQGNLVREKGAWRTAEGRRKARGIIGCGAKETVVVANFNKDLDIFTTMMEC